MTETQELIHLLESRGLSVVNKSKAEHCLKFGQNLKYIGYNRLSAYMYPLLEIPKENHIYKQGSNFDKVLMLFSIKNFANSCGQSLLPITFWLLLICTCLAFIPFDALLLVLSSEKANGF